MVSRDYTKSKFTAPHDKDSLNYLVWLFIGGNNANFSGAARQLGISPSSLNKILHGKRKISQTLVQNKQWRATFARMNPEQWSIYKDKFEALIKSSPRKRGKPSREPKDKKSIGYAIWNIIGGKNVHVAQAAEKLEISSPYLSRIIHNHRQLSPQYIDKKEWEKIFAQHFPEGWAANKDDYFLAKQNLNHKKRVETAATSTDSSIRRPARKTMPTLQQKWKMAVGELIGRIFQERGDTFQDIMKDVKNPKLKKTSLWQDVLSGRNNRHMPVYREVLQEVCRLYNLAASEPNHQYVQAQRLLDTKL